MIWRTNVSRKNKIILGEGNCLLRARKEVMKKLGIAEEANYMSKLYDYVYALMICNLFICELKLSAS